MPEIHLRHYAENKLAPIRRKLTVGAKPWKYLLLPHDEIAESKRLSDYLRFEVKG